VISSVRALRIGDIMTEFKEVRMDGKCGFCGTLPVKEIDYDQEGNKYGYSLCPNCGAELTLGGWRK
jgi:hypothetical protein